MRWRCSPGSSSSGLESGTFRLSTILDDPPDSTLTTVALVLVLLGAFTKSAQYPFQSWLPAAMVAPTPISTYLHSATMVKAGVYLIGRLAPAFVDLGWWRPVVVGVGVVTMIAGGLRALRQTDLKLLLAMGTISQLGFMVAILGWGTPEAAVAGGVLLLAHGAFKATAFMVVGILDQQYGTRDLRRIPRPGPGWWPTAVAAVVAAGSMAGIPLLLGFVAKESAFTALTDAGGGGGLALAAVVVGSALTVAYSYRFASGCLGRHADGEVAGGSAPALAFAAPAVLLSVAHGAARAVAGARRWSRRRVGAGDRTVGRAGAPGRLARLEPAVGAVGGGHRRRRPDRRRQRALAIGERGPMVGAVDRRRVPGLATRAQRDRQPRDDGGAAGLAARLPRRDPPDGGDRAGAAAC